MRDRIDKIIILSIIAGAFIFLSLTGTISSGFHFVDDHEVIRMKNDFQSASFLDVSKKWVNEDLKVNTRFRPVYYIHRVAQSKLFGSDFMLWSLYNAFLCCTALILFYLGIRNLKFTVSESLVFLVVIFIGPQSSVWWRLGPGESLGMVFLGFAFYFMSDSLNSKGYLINNLLFIFSLILASLTKESFLLIIPAMIFFKVWNESNNLKTIRLSINKNLLLIIPLIVVILELYYIRYFVGTSYAGLDSGIIDTFKSVSLTFLHFINTYLIIFISIILLIIISIFIKKKISGPNLFPVILFGLILVPNMILYAKYGLVERYILPSSFGLGFLVVVWLRSIHENPVWYKKLSLLIVLFSFLPFVFNITSDAIDFAKEGTETNHLLAAISNSHPKSDQVMVIADPVEDYEKSVSLKTFLYYEQKIDLFGYPFLSGIDTSANRDYIEGWKSYFGSRQYENMVIKPDLLIFLKKNMVEQFFIESKIDREKYSDVQLLNSSYRLLKLNN